MNLFTCTPGTTVSEAKTATTCRGWFGWESLTLDILPLFNNDDQLRFCLQGGAAHVHPAWQAWSFSVPAYLEYWGDLDPSRLHHGQGKRWRWYTLLSFHLPSDNVQGFYQSYHPYVILLIKECTICFFNQGTLNINHRMFNRNPQTSPIT